MMSALDLPAICRNHVEGPQRRDPHAHSTCRACGQTWPCDASRLAVELMLGDAQLVDVPAGARVIVRLAPGRLTYEIALRMKSELVERRPDVDWLILEADELAATPNDGGTTDARCQDHDEEATDQEARQGEEGGEENAGRSSS